MLHSLDAVLPGRSAGDALEVADLLARQDELVVLVGGEKVTFSSAAARLLASTVRSVADGLPVVVRGADYLSPREAAQLLGVSPQRS